MTDVLPDPNADSGIRRLLRNRLARLLRKRQRNSPPAAPTPSVSRLVAALDRTCDPRARSATTTGAGARDELLAASYRQLIGGRFFASPERLAQLHRELQRICPEVVERWSRLVERDRNEGLPVYEQAGRPMGRGYPWAAPCDETGDLLHRVRPHRFGFLPRWAKAGLADRQRVEEIGAILAGWRECLRQPQARTLAYASNLVVFQRVLACLWSWAFVAAGDAHARDTRVELELLAIVEADTAFLWPRLGDAYPNNHLLIDRFAAWFLERVTPEFIAQAPAAPASDARDAWLRELDRQVYPDGTSFEHSLHYHEFATDLVSAYRLLSRRADLAPPDWLAQRHSLMIDFQQALTSGAGEQAVGDATEDPLFPLDDAHCWTSVNHEPIRRVLAGETPAHTAPAEGARVCELATWLTGVVCVEHRDRIQAKRGLRRFPDGGYFVLQGAGGVDAILRTGPNPDARSTGGHCKADLLSILVRRGETPFVVEAGTFTYRAARRTRGFVPRAYFLGPESHNGLAIPGVDPLGQVRADFRNHDVVAGARTRWAIERGALAWVEAVICGGGPYEGHRRGVIAAGGQLLVVYDVPTAETFSRGGFYAFQLSPQVSASVDPQARLVRLDGRTAAMSIAHAGAVAAPVLLCGSTDPVAGWVSPSYGELLPAPQLRYAIDCAAMAAFVIAPTPATARLAPDPSGRGAFVLSVELDARRHRFEIMSAPPGTTGGDAACRLAWTIDQEDPVVIEAPAIAAP